jgi:hypothetical protein
MPTPERTNRSTWSNGLVTLAVIASALGGEYLIAGRLTSLIVIPTILVAVLTRCLRASTREDEQR